MLKDLDTWCTWAS